ncbi:hypothetical protein [Chondromyces crocatus]|uniref:Uncharacterized protein n=1 Tax=Chondromyces crocatus TaxID=52 RepID=A0A0K1E5R2_CHOCO|nr:hypothetical protein [Chondromyces crocatus]AKT35913.1 uncharacterized protein CMC5_000240 [Chondromyces crocatus]
MTRWEHNGGDLRAAADGLAKARSAGALLGIEIESDSLEKARDDEDTRDREGELIRKAWETAVAVLPSAAVGRRTRWSRFEFILEGKRGGMGVLGERLLTAFKRDDDLSALEWHLIFTEIFVAEPERTFLCDPGYDLRTAEGMSAIAWVEPYPGADWKTSQRHPTVTFLRLGPPLSQGAQD